MSERICPVPACANKLGTTKQGDPWAFCRKHFHRLDAAHQMKLWRAYRSWQRLERQWLRTQPGERPPALMEARALAINEYLETREECIRKITGGQAQQLEMAQ